MGKSHRDNHRARVKRGPVAFAKKAERRSQGRLARCSVCGGWARPKKLLDGMCMQCRERMGLAAVALEF